MTWRKILPVFLVLLCSACIRLTPPPQSFETVQADYAARLRWRDYNAAARYMLPDLGDDFRRRFAGLSGLNITEVRLESAEYAGDGKRLTACSSIEYFLLPSATVKTFRYEQTWELVGADRWHAGTWLIVTPFPPFPGESLPEPK